MTQKNATHTHRQTDTKRHGFLWLSTFQEAFHFEALDAAQLPITNWAERFDVVMDKAMLDAILSGRWKQCWMLGWLGMVGGWLVDSGWGWLSQQKFVFVIGLDCVTLYDDEVSC